MSPLILSAALILFATGVAHSYLGERYILIRLFRRDLPRLFGSDGFTKGTLRWAWHITTIAWWGFAALVLLVGAEPTAPTNSLVLRCTSAVFGVHMLVALTASRGRHLSWLAFGAVAALTWWASG